MYFKTQQHPGPWELYQIIKQSCNTLKHFDTDVPHLGNRVPSRRASLRTALAQYDVYRLNFNTSQTRKINTSLTGYKKTIKYNYKIKINSLRNP